MLPTSLVSTLLYIATASMLVGAALRVWEVYG